MKQTLQKLKMAGVAGVALAEALLWEKVHEVLMRDADAVACWHLGSCAHHEHCYHAARSLGMHWRSATAHSAQVAGA